MKRVNKKYMNLSIIFVIIIIIIITLTFPPIRNSIPIYASQEILNWIDLVMIPVILAISTGGLITVWFSYKNEKELTIDGLRRELDSLSIHNFELLSKILNIYYNPFIENRAKNSQVFSILAYKPENYFLRHEYQELYDYVIKEYKTLSENFEITNLNIILPEIQLTISKINDKINNTREIFNATY